MRLIKQSLDRDSMGPITLFPEEPEDMWHVYNLLHPGDLLRSTAIRKIQTESSTGSTSTHRVHTSLTITIEKIDFDPASSSLHLNGRVAAENPYVKMGSYHTLDLELQRNFTVEKKDGWDSVSLGVVRDACDAGERAEIGAVVMHEGVAHVCLVTEFMTVLRQRIEVTIPRKRAAIPEAHDRGIEKFYSQIYSSMKRHLPFDKLKVILLASPGFLAEGLLEHILSEATKLDDRIILKSKPKFLTAHTSSGHIHSLNELLKTPEVLSRLSDTRFMREARAMDSFFVMMQTDENRAWYGPKEVERAVERGAVKTLLVSNSLFRSNDVAERKRYVRMVEDVRKGGAGEALILSSIHESGRRLDGLGGVAAILSWPIEDLDASDDEEGEGQGGSEGGQGGNDERSREGQE